MRIFYDKKTERQNIIVISVFSLIFLVSGILWAIFLPEERGFSFVFLAMFLLMLACVLLCVKRLKTPFCLEFTEEGVKPPKGKIIPYEQIQCFVFTAELPTKLTQDKNPHTVVYAARPIVPHCRGTLRIVTLQRSYVFVSLYDICESYEAAKAYGDAELIYTKPGDEPALYIYDRYK